MLTEVKIPDNFMPQASYSAGNILNPNHNQNQFANFHLGTFSFISTLLDPSL